MNNFWIVFFQDFESDIKHADFGFCHPCFLFGYVAF